MDMDRMDTDMEVTVSFRGTAEQVLRVLQQVQNRSEAAVSGSVAAGKEDVFDRDETERLWKEIRSKNARRIIYEIAKHPKSKGGIKADAVWEAVGVDNRTGPGMLSSAGTAGKRVDFWPNWLGWSETTRTYTMRDDIATVFRELAKGEALEEFEIGAE